MEEQECRQGADEEGEALRSELTGPSFRGWNGPSRSLFMSV